MPAHSQPASRSSRAPSTHLLLGFDGRQQRGNGGARVLGVGWRRHDHHTRAARKQLNQLLRQRQPRRRRVAWRFWQLPGRHISKSGPKSGSSRSQESKGIAPRHGASRWAVQEQHAADLSDAAGASWHTWGSTDSRSAISVATPALVMPRARVCVQAGQRMPHAARCELCQA